MITYRGALRSSFVLVRADLIPATNPPRGNWHETWQLCLETLRRCVYLDKDLVLPPVAASSPAESFYVVASTDMERAGIMTTRIREQLERIADLKNKAALTITAVPVELPAFAAGLSLEKQVQEVGDRVTEMIMTSMKTTKPREEGR